MKLTAFNGYTFSIGGYTAGLPDGQSLGDYTVSPQTIERRATAPLLTGATITPRSITADFLHDGVTGGLTLEQAFQKLVGILDPTNDDPRTLTAQLNDGTVVVCEAIVLTPQASFGDEEVTSVPVTFLTMDPFWRKTTDATTTLTTNKAAAIALANTGTARAYPTFDIHASSIGGLLCWQYRKWATIANDSDEDWTDEPVCVDLSDTAALLGLSKVLTNGDDIRVRRQGRELRRTLVNMNTKRTLVWFLASIKAGQSAAFEIVYGNDSVTDDGAGDLSTRTGNDQSYIAFDLEGDNGTATAGAGSTLTDSGKSWETNRWANAIIMITSGTGANQRRRILSNTSQVITANRAWSTQPDATSTYVIWASGIFADGGRVTSRTANSITDTAHTTKWGTNQLEGATVKFIGGSGATPSTMTVAGNTTDTISFTGSFSVQPAVNDSYTIERYGMRAYVVDTAINNSLHRGLYRINRYYTPPGNVWPGQLTPAGWGPDTYLDNDDDFSQLRPYDSGSGGGHSSNYQPTLRARRRVRQKAQYKDEGIGDGMSTFVPMQLQGVYWDFQVKNTNGIGKVVLAYKEPAGEDWQDAYTYTTTQASLTNVAAQYTDLDAVNNPTRLGIFVAAADGVDIGSDTSTADEIEARTNDVLILYLDLSSFGGLSNSVYAVGSEENVWDARLELRLGGGEESVKAPPYDLVAIGGEDRWLHLKTSDHLIIRTDPETDQPLVDVVDGSGVRQYRAAWAVRFERHEANVDGDDTALVSRDFMPVRPIPVALTNGSFATNLTGWADGGGSGGVTFTWARDAGVFWDAAGSLKFNCTAAPGSAWFRNEESTQNIPVTPGGKYNIAGAFRVTTLAYSVEIGAMEYDANGVGLGGVSAVFLPGATGTWYPVAWEYEPSDPATAYIHVYVAVNAAGATTGSAYFDGLTWDAPTLYVGGDISSTLVVATTITEGFNG